jgi:hypothetical protein
MIPKDEFQPLDTMKMRVLAKTQVDRTTRETVGNTTGIAGGSVLVLWLANLVGIDMPEPAAVVVGSVLSTVISSLLRKYLQNAH